MWSIFTTHLPSMGTVIIALFAVFAIAGIYRFNQVLHEKGDPPWKKDKQKKREK